jgi:hypothetical protein
MSPDVSRSFLTYNLIYNRLTFATQNYADNHKKYHYKIFNHIN